MEQPQTVPFRPPGGLHTQVWTLGDVHCSQALITAHLRLTAGAKLNISPT